jgi:quercetin dioxygenase-like cupin family protein
MSRLIEFATAERIARGDGIESVRLTDPPLPGQTFVMGITSFPPGAGLSRHSHNTVEQVTVLAGTGIVELGDEQHRVAAHDTTQIPDGEPHRFVNDGDEELRILWVYGRTDVTRTFTDTGETVTQLAGPPGG